MKSAQQEVNLQRIARKLDKLLERSYSQKMGFFLCVAPFDENSNQTDYIGNCSRETAIEWMEETLTRLKQRQTIPTPKHTTLQ